MKPGPPTETHVNPCPTVSVKGQLQLRVSSCGMTFCHGVGGNPQEAHPNAACFLTALDSPGSGVFSPHCLLKKFG